MGCMGSRTVRPSDLSLEDNMQRLEKKFQEIDKNGDGQVDKGEFAKMLPDLGITWDEEKINDAMDKLDADKSGTISSREFKSACYLACMRNPNLNIDEILAMVIRQMVAKGPMDKAVRDAASGGDGRSGLLKGMKATTPPERKIVQEDLESKIESEFTKLDSDMDGLINIEEFCDGVEKLGLGWSRPKIDKVMNSISSSGTLNFLQFKLTLMASAQSNKDASVAEIFRIALNNLAAKIAANEAFRENKIKNMLKRVDNTFDQIDENKDGKLDQGEFTKACKEVFMLDWDDATIAKVLKQIDTDNNNTIERVEFTNAFYAACMRNPDADLTEMIESVLTTMAGRASLGGALAGGIQSLKKVDAPEEKKYFQEDVMSQISQKFAEIDVNRDGAINLEEFGKALTDLGLKWQAKTVENVLNDVGSNGEIAFSQFRGVLDAATNAAPDASVDEVLKNALLNLRRKTLMNQQFNNGEIARKTKALNDEFKKRDKDGNNVLDFDEFSAACSAWGLDWTAEQTRAVLRKIDTDGSGDVSLKEFKRFFSLAASKNPTMDLDEIIKVALQQMVNSGGLVQGIAGGVALRKRKAPETRTPEEDTVSKIASKFQEMDTDGDGALSVEEFAAGLQSLGLKWPDYKIRGALRSIDKDNSGDISFSEFSQLLYPALNAFPSKNVDEILQSVLVNFAEKSKMNIAFHARQQKSMLDTVEKKFKEMDKNGDGQLDAGEFANLVTAAGLQWSPEETAAALKKMDTDGSGTISAKEFKSALYMACMRNPDASVDVLLEAVLKRMQAQGGMNSQLANAFPELKKATQKRTKVEEDAISKIESAFMKIDVNRDGVLTPRELSTMASSLGLSMDEKEADEMIAAIDVDGTGRLNIADFAHVVGTAATKNPSATEEDIIKISLQSLARKRAMKTQLRENNLKQKLRKMDNLFKTLDTDKDGKLNLAEFSTGVKSFSLSWTDDEIADCLRKIDSDGNGYIERAEFQTAFYNACIKNPDLGLDEIVPAALTQMMNKGELNKRFVQDFSKVAGGLRKTKKSPAPKASSLGSTDVISQIEEKFQQLDMDLDGSLSVSEMSAALTNLGLKWDTPKVAGLVAKLTDGESENVQFKHFKPVMVNCANRHPDWTVDQVLRTALTNLASKKGVGAEIRKRSMSG